MVLPANETIQVSADGDNVSLTIVGAVAGVDGAMADLHLVMPADAAFWLSIQLHNSGLVAKRNDEKARRRLTVEIGDVVR